MLGIRLSWLRASLGALAVFLLASGAAWAHGGGGGGHGGGGGGHGGGGHGGVGHAGGFGHGGVGHVGNFGVGGVHHGGLYGSGFTQGLGYNPSFGRGLYTSGFSRGLGYNSAFGRGYPYGFGYGLGLGYPYGLGSGFGLGYSLGNYYGGMGGYYGQSGLGYGLGYPYSGAGYGVGLPYFGYNTGLYGAYPYSYYGYGSSPYYGTNSFYGPLLSQYSAAGGHSQTEPPPQDDMAHLLVIVQDNAELWFNGAQTKQSGPQREFISPKLTPGKRYSYDIKARWKENGKMVEQVRTAHVQANNWQVIDFTKPEQSTAQEKK